MKDVKLSGGAILGLGVVPFAKSKALWQAMLREIKDIHLISKTEMANVYKDLFCASLSSSEVETALWACFEHCTYNSGKSGALKIDQDTFEPVEAREDYLTVCFEVAKECIFPFVKSHYAKLGPDFLKVLNDLK